MHTSLSSHTPQLRKQKEDEIRLNRLYLAKVIETLTFLSLQNIAVRGDKEDRSNICVSSNVNRGNFIELLHLRSKDLSWFKDKFQDLVSRHKQWLSWDIQNEILELVASYDKWHNTSNFPKKITKWERALWTLTGVSSGPLTTSHILNTIHMLNFIQKVASLT